MRKTILILTITTVACIGLSPVLFAQASAPGTPLVSIAQEAKAKIKTTAAVAIFLNGNDALLTGIMEDALNIRLSNMGFTVVSREKLEKSVGEQIAKMSKEKEGGAVNALEIGRAVNADLVLTGTVIVELAQDRPLLVKVASFQLIEVINEKTLIGFLSEPEKGKSFSEMSGELTDLVRRIAK
jgi:hypothetical protein